MKLLNVHGLLLSSTEEMKFSKYLSKNNIAMNTKSAGERMTVVLEWKEYYKKQVENEMYDKD